MSTLPDLSTSTMESALRPLEEHLVCDECKRALRERIKNLVVQWSIVKVRLCLLILYTTFSYDKVFQRTI